MFIATPSAVDKAVQILRNVIEGAAGFLVIRVVARDAGDRGGQVGRKYGPSGCKHGVSRF